ncbi:MAG: DNA repair protein RecN [Candidatus Solincola sediminis]|uniref:DNA repair protein RecN n=1 Tax=Candidatus Solincola sediminis TaxID=1797199 RepID=A0A1F2WTK0_9ACTN|nr:MAG: DNA repair protein RecN [Candidatus Solincola sediminis]OFW60861.1 MAG: DNA repair protein RecN [Candidatus Solincola sediminis]
MLRELRVRNLALIEEACLDFGPGLNALTGETGAGKTVLVEALDLLLGGRGDSGLIKPGAEKLELEAAFDVEDNHAVRRIAEEEGFEVDGEIILRRVIGADGKSRCYVNGRMSTVAALARLGERLVDIHGQHEHQRLLKPSSHLEYLDDFGGPEHLNLLAGYRSLWEGWKKAEEYLAKITMDEAERLREIDLLVFQVREIEAVRPLDGEMEELLKERKRMQNREELFNNAREAYALAAGSEGEGGIIESLGMAESAIEKAAALDEDLKEWSIGLRAAQDQLSEITHAMLSYVEALDFEPGRLEEAESRLKALGDLARKYGPETSEILAHLESSKLRLEELSNLDEAQDEAREEAARLEAELYEAAEGLSTSRKALADRLTRETNKELKDMNMAGMTFRIDIQRAPEPLQSGRDIVEFTVSPGKDISYRSLGRIASGGELSRIMLALKLALARADAVPTLVFDEVDSGIGGATADILAAKLSLIGNYHQVFSITHLPQIAALSKRHLSVRKDTRPKGISTSIEILEAESRVDELVRMLGGDKTTARKHAEAMLRNKA